MRRLVTTVRQPRQRQVFIALLGLAALAVFLLWRGSRFDSYDGNLALNLGAEIVGVIVTVFLITPLITRAQDGRVREHPRLDYLWFTDQVHGASYEVRILDTFSRLFEAPTAELFLRGVEKAIGRSARVRVLLLDPDSLAVRARAEELGGSVDDAEVRREIMRNLQVLYRFGRKLTAAQRKPFEVRLIAGSAGVTWYRWDDKALVSFLTIGRLSGQGAQLEVTVESPLGVFVEHRFEELWRQARSLDDFMQLDVTVVDARGGSRAFASRFVVLDECTYVHDHDVVSHMARRRDADLSALTALDAYHYELVVVDDEMPELQTRLGEQFVAKYDTRPSTFVWLRPR